MFRGGLGNSSSETTSSGADLLILDLWPVIWDTSRLLLFSSMISKDLLDEVWYFNWRTMLFWYCYYLSELSSSSTIIIGLSEIFPSLIYYYLVSSFCSDIPSLFLFLSSESNYVFCLFSLGSCVSSSYYFMNQQQPIL